MLGAGGLAQSASRVISWYRIRRGVASTDSATAAAQPQRVGARRQAAIVPITSRAAQSAGEIAYGDQLVTSPTVPRLNTLGKARLPAGSRTSWRTASPADQAANRPRALQSRRPIHQIAASAGRTLRWVARASAHGLPIAIRNVTGTWACPMTTLQAIGRASIPTRLQPRTPGRISRTSPTSEATTINSQIAAATGNGKRASGRNAIASSGG